MKRIVVFIAGLILVVNLAACQKNSVDTPKPIDSIQRAMRIDYADLSPTDAMTTDQEQDIKNSGITLLGVGAGRVDWSYFPWSGHQADWAEAVRMSGVDFLARDTKRFSQWAEVTAVIDVLAPVYIQNHQDAAAVSWGGQASRNLVSLTQMTSGAFSQQLLDFINAVSKRTSAGSVTLVELFYYVDGFGADDLVSFTQKTGFSDWPRLASGEININDKNITQWRDQQLEILLTQVAEIVHQNNKEFYLEVKPTPVQLQDQDWTSYLAYLKYADKLIVFGNPIFSEPDPAVIKTAIQNLNSFGTEKMIFELGLWQDDAERTSDVPIAMTPEAFGRLYLAATQAGVTSFWFTPSYLITSVHLDKIIDK